MITQTEINQLLGTDLFAELEMERLSPEERISFAESFGEVVESRVLRRLNDELSDEQKDALNKLLNAKSDDRTALDAFLQTKEPDLGRLVAEETANYKKELLDGFNSMREAVDINE